MFVSAETRWFWQNDCPTNLRRWFVETSPAAGGGQARIDHYLLLTGESEISIKRRGESPDVEIKGLVATLRNERASFAPDVELWCKWRVQASALEITDKVIVRKARWLRTYDASGAAIVEIPASMPSCRRSKISPKTTIHTASTTSAASNTQGRSAF
jgi:hypothetical protein